MKRELTLGVILVLAVAQFSCGKQGGSPDESPDTTKLCGNGVVNSAAGSDTAEACDDGNNVSGDGCDITCQIEPGGVCPPEGGACTRCGNLVKEKGEECDDGNLNAGDGCSKTCRIEPGSYCPTTGFCTVCGNLIVSASSTHPETCDDGMHCANGDPCTLATGCTDSSQCQPRSEDGCSNTCQVEPGGWTCPTSGGACNRCGDGIIQGDETCDDGDIEPGDGCDASCHKELVVNYTGYLMFHFIGEGLNGEQIYMSHSDDGLHWNDLHDGSPVLRSTIGSRGVRDPSIIRSPAGDHYWIIATDLCIGCGTSWSDASSKGSKLLTVWESTNLVNWTGPRLLDVAGEISGAGNAWAPEAIYDPDSDDYVVYWATKSNIGGVYKHRIWYAHTSDFQSVSTPQIYINRPGTQNIIDTQIISAQDSAGGYRYYRASGDGQITIEGANSILGTWTSIGNLSGIGLTGSLVEGPMWARFNDRREWTLWLDQYATGKGYLPITPTNLSDTSSYVKLTEYDLGSTHKRHGSILNLTAEEETRVLEAFKSTPISWIQSYNYPDRYVRHYNFDIRIDPNVSPATDSQFRVVPGLADDSSGYVSFEAVNFPGYYLRHDGDDFALMRNDASTQFARDATFMQVDGLADATWSSFRAYNYVDHYIYHDKFELRIGPAVDAIKQASATFRIVN